MKTVVAYPDGSRLVHTYEELTEDKRPQDPHGDGTGLTFETLEHGGEYPDAMPQAIRLADAAGRSCVYLPVQVDGRVVDSMGFELIPADAETGTMPRARVAA